MLSNLTDVTVETLLSQVAVKRPHGYRFVTLTCIDVGEAYEIYYHFDKNYVLENLRLRLPKGQVLPSISGVYFAAVVVENEIKDLFGIEFDGLILDYESRFLLTADAPQAPQNKTVAPPAAGGKEGA